MTLITNIAEIVGIAPKGVLRKQGAEMDELTTLKDAWIAIRDGRIAAFGPMSTLPTPCATDEVIDAEGGLVLPSFCDSHTHIC